MTENSVLDAAYLIQRNVGYMKTHKIHSVK